MPFKRGAANVNFSKRTRTRLAVAIQHDPDRAQSSGPASNPPEELEGASIYPSLFCLGPESGGEQRAVREIQEPFDVDTWMENMGEGEDTPLLPSQTQASCSVPLCNLAVRRAKLSCAKTLLFRRSVCFFVGIGLLTFVVITLPPNPTVTPKDSVVHLSFDNNSIMALNQTDGDKLFDFSFNMTLPPAKQSRVHDITILSAECNIGREGGGKPSLEALRFLVSKPTKLVTRFTVPSSLTCRCSDYSKISEFKMDPGDVAACKSAGDGKGCTWMPSNSVRLFGGNCTGNCVEGPRPDRSLGGTGTVLNAEALRSLTPLEAPDEDAYETTGLQWRNIGVIRPGKGAELTHFNLSLALMNKADERCKHLDKWCKSFTQEEWDALGIRDLRMDNFIRSEDSYFKTISLKKHVSIFVDCTISIDLNLYWGIVSIPFVFHVREKFDRPDVGQTMLKKTDRDSLRDALLNLPKALSFGNVPQHARRDFRRTDSGRGVQGLLFQPKLPFMKDHSGQIRAVYIHLPAISWDMTPTFLGVEIVDNFQEKDHPPYPVMTIGSLPFTWVVVVGKSSTHWKDRNSIARLFATCTGGCGIHILRSIAGIAMEAVTTHPLLGFSISSKMSSSPSFFIKVFGEKNMFVLVRPSKTTRTSLNAPGCTYTCVCVCVCV